MSDLNLGNQPTATTTTSAPPPAAPSPAPSAPVNDSPTPKGATVVSDREARKDESASPESYTDTGKLTTDKWKEKVAKYNKKAGKTSKEPSDEPLAAKAYRPEAAPSQNPEESTPEVLEEVQEPLQEGSEAEEGQGAGEAFKFDPKFTAVGKEYKIPDYLAKAIKSPEQLQEVQQLFSKAAGLEHTKLRHQELQDKYVGLETDHNDVVDGITELKEIYSEAVRTQQPLLLNEFFQKLQIPPQVVLQYAESVRQFLEMAPEQQQTLSMSLETQRRARDLGKQNQRLTQGSFQANVSARNIELESALARPEINTTVQSFESKFGPGSFRQELIRNGVYVWQTEQKDLSIAENVNQVLRRFGLQAGQAQGSPAPAPQGQAPAPFAPAPQQPAAAPQGQATPVIPAPQAHRKVPVIPGVTGKSSSPAKAQPRSIEDIRKIRKQKYGS